ncbi:MAG TPA: hypothetical protein PKY82_07920 [Pyrinomonadaceae bacterium]|jgi:hypothetical protein|nr:hypothetical protein [Pyrinomonadaceae bacterium]
MLKLLVLALLSLWTLGVLFNRLFDGYIHLLLFGVVVAVAVRYFTENKLLD